MTSPIKIATATLLTSLLLSPALHAAASPDYPAAPRGTVSDNYFGTTVADPYRWLENVDSPETLAWVKAQQAYTTPRLEALPERAPLKARLTALWNYERRSLPEFAGKSRFFTKNNGLQNQSVLYVQAGNAAPRVLLDPNTLAADGTTALSSYKASPDGKLLAYSMAEAGSDWEVIRFRTVATGKDLPDVLRRVKFSGLSWSGDGAVLAYSRYPDAAAGGESTFEKLGAQALYLHRLGQAQKDDVLLHQPEDPSWFVGGAFSDDGHTLSISVTRGTDDDNRLTIVPLAADASPDSQQAPLLIGKDFSANYEVIGNVGNTFYLLTSDAAQKKRVVSFDIKQPDPSGWRTVIPESKDVLTQVELAGGHLLAHTLHNAASRLTRYSLDGKLLNTVELPGLGDASALTGKPKQRNAYFSFNSFAAPGVIYRLDMQTGKVARDWSPKLQFAPAEYVTEQVFYSSRDGTQVPMFISYKKGLKKTGETPTLLYAYGGFNISLLPAFSAQNLAWMERGGIYAQPNLRGGGEYGEAWHKAGTKAQKQNVFDDFAAAAQYLIREKYTSPKHLGIYGRSNGGLLIGATLNQHPELFAAGVPGVGVMDMLRFHQFTVGAAWRDDYGSSETAEGFAYIYPYSPVHNVKPGVAYPPTLTITADHDDRVVPGHSFKYAAAMQWANSAPNAVNPNPQWIRIEERGGHGAGKPVSKKIEEVADVLAFLAHYTQ